MATDQIIDIADLDCIFLTYDEPKKEEFWIKIQNLVPWAKHVDGVKGSDAAHKAAAAESDTDFFVLIDGDNIPDEAFFNLQLQIREDQHDHAFRWKARNHINGLMYGNGGLSVWSKTFVNNMRTHEASDGSDHTSVEFCFDPKYIPMHNCYSTTYPNASPEQAWRAGFREGVKMCLNKGTKPTLQEFEEKVHGRNYDHLCIWQSVGSDVVNGDWAILGARQGTQQTMLTQWDYREVQDFDKLKELFTTLTAGITKINICTKIDDIGFDLTSRLGLPIVNYDPDESMFFKYHYSTSHKNLALMTTEMSVIRQQQGW
jgi:hypothetical protein